MSKTFYAVSNWYGSETSQGFSNTWYGLAFIDKKSRDDFVSANEYRNLAVRACKKSQISKYLEKPKPFSYTHRAVNPFNDLAQNICGCLGIIEIMHNTEGYRL